jgi:hypothetical protein
MIKRKTNKEIRNTKSRKYWDLPIHETDARFLSVSGEDYQRYDSITYSTHDPSSYDVLWINLQPWNRGYEHHNKLIIKYLQEFNTPEEIPKQEDIKNKMDMLDSYCCVLDCIADALARYKPWRRI